MLVIVLSNFTRTHCDYVFITYGQNWKTVGQMIKEALVRSHFRAKQTNQLFLNVQKNTDNCYLIPFQNKNLGFISEQRKN